MLKKASRGVRYQWVIDDPSCAVAIHRRTDINYASVRYSYHYPQPVTNDILTDGHTNLGCLRSEYRTYKECNEGNRRVWPAMNMIRLFRDRYTKKLHVLQCPISSGPRNRLPMGFTFPPLLQLYIVKSIRISIVFAWFHNVSINISFYFEWENERAEPMAIRSQLLYLSYLVTRLVPMAFENS